MLGPVVAVFTGPGFGPITGTAERHIIGQVPLVGIDIPGNFVRHTVVNLEISRFQDGLADSAAGMVRFDNLALKTFRKYLSASGTVVAYVLGIAKSVAGDLSSVRVGCPEHFQGQALLSHVSYRARRMLVSSFLQVFRRHMTVLEDVFDNDPGSLPANRLGFVKNGSWSVSSVHRVTNRSRSSAKTFGTPRNRARIAGER